MEERGLRRAPASSSALFPLPSLNPGRQSRRGDRSGQQQVLRDRHDLREVPQVALRQGQPTVKRTLRSPPMFLVRDDWCELAAPGGRLGLRLVFHWPGLSPSSKQEQLEAKGALKC